MSTTLPKHQCLELSANLQEYSHGFLNKYGLNYFQYLRVFNDGSFSIGVNKANWLEFALGKIFQEPTTPAVYSHISKDQIAKQSYMFLWEPNLPTEPVKLAKEFNIHNGITFVERHANFYDMMAFASPEVNHTATDTYLNNIDRMQNFILGFKRDQAKLIQQLDKHRIYPKKSQQEHLNLNKMLLEGNKAITMQESACLRLLTQGLTYKNIAKILNISPRTVETYLNRIKCRYNINCKHELIALYQKIN
jgi:DNA-binding CsgD family transcriptional regulator